MRKFLVGLAVVASIGGAQAQQYYAPQPVQYVQPDPALMFMNTLFRVVIENELRQEQQPQVIIYNQQIRNDRPRRVVRHREVVYRGHGGRGYIIDDHRSVRTVQHRGQTCRQVGYSYDHRGRRTGDRVSCD